MIVNEEIAIKICEQMTSDVHDLCICCRKNEKDRTCIGCRELAIETILKENERLKDKIEKATNFVDKYMNQWDFQDEVWQDMNDLLILLKEN